MPGNARTSLAAIADLITTADRRGLVLRDNLTSEHHRVHPAILELVRAGRIGAPRFFQGSFRIPPLPGTDIRDRPDLAGYPLTAARNVGGSALSSTPGGETATVAVGFEHGCGSRYLVWGSTGRISCDRVGTPPDDRFGNCLTDFAAAVDAAQRTGTDPGAAAWRARRVRVATGRAGRS
ncbi:hypothetical protein Q5425_28210 [Amycolatopsis sp. A133]|uniref:hypothetical protein n=1 Tax=Amycolatopsis sp. A133 TaxID=3064472 RepID=UPI0027E7FC4D|nr:hypothetical protein [Amycolatopsis sp. A133]MDQ7807638.1 hypothetical protein [Amycolatopsis sp. A133]